MKYSLVWIPDVLPKCQLLFDLHFNFLLKWDSWGDNGDAEDIQTQKRDPKQDTQVSQHTGQAY